MTRLERQAMIASAGSGKTYQLSGRLIRLLALGVAVEKVFASTFTRKAAGEIAQRVLKRLADAALDDRQAKGLADQTGIAWLDRAACRTLLAGVVRRMHRLNIGTLDAFFNRAAGCYALELGLPPGWTIAGDVDAARLKADAIAAVLEHDNRDRLITLLRQLGRGRAERKVHDQLDTLIDELHTLYREAQPSAWQITYDPSPRLSRQRIEQIVDDAQHVQLPCSEKTGKVNGHWKNALGKLIDLAWCGDFDALATSGLVRAAVSGDPYHRLPATDSFTRWVQPLAAHARVLKLERLAYRLHAMRELIGDYDATFGMLQRRRGLYRFEDITDTLRDADPLAGDSELYLRLDAKCDHVLLDEFQDTSIAQWQAIAPIVDEAAQSDGERALLIVADPKQSIYGWRGGEPRLTLHVRDHYALDEQPLHESWRTGQGVLDGVNRVFEGIAAAPALADHADAAADWARAFAPHKAAKTDRPGYVQLALGPEAAGDKAFGPALAEYAADLVADIAREAPGFSIGVLMRTNQSVARMIYELNQRRIAASEEGGNPLTDCAAVVAVLSLLTLADHPADTIARYLVAHTPLGAVVGLGPGHSETDAHRLAAEVRRELLVDGYGPTLSRWVGELAGACDGRDMRRLLQLVQLGWAYESTATLRPGDFVRMVQATRVEDPSAAAVRVMTIHKSKGLEFDAVVLPQLESPWFSQNPDLVFERAEAIGPITAICPRVEDAWRALLPGVDAIHRAHEASRIRDALSTLYVAMTRPRYALYMIAHPPGKTDDKLTFGRVLRDALLEADAPTSTPLTRDAYAHGDAGWMNHAQPSMPQAAQDPVPLRAKLGPAGRPRGLARTSPSALEGGQTIDLATALRLDAPGSTAGRSRGSIMHALAQRIEWLDAGPLTGAAWREALAQAAPDLDDASVAMLIEQFGQAIAAAPIAAALKPSAYPADAAPTVQRERRFAIVEDDTLLQGAFDRLVLLHDSAGRPVAAEVLDYKTDVAPIDQIVAHYRPQLDAYRRAAAKLYRLDAEKVAAKLILLHYGQVVQV